MDYYYITGVSRGLGRALADRLLERTDSAVIGLGRTSTIASPHFQHVQLDLSDLDAVCQFAFPPNRGARRLVLVNNAAAFTPKRLGRVDPRTIVHDYHVNLVAPTLLINSFIQAYSAHTADKQIVNITSLAGSALFDGLPVYSASKAGINMVSRVADLEQKLGAGRIRVLAVDPGGVDTDMQAAARAADAHDFSRVEAFVESKESGRLADPEIVAEKVWRLIDDLSLTTDVVVSVFDVVLPVRERPVRANTQVQAEEKTGSAQSS